MCSSDLDPPYDDEALEPDLPYDGRDLLGAMARAIAEARPTIVVLPDPADVHPDHRATAAFAMLALSDVGAGSGRASLRPRLLTFLVHWPAWPPGWDRSPRDGDCELPLAAPVDLPRRDLEPRRLELVPQEVARKRAALPTRTGASRSRTRSGSRTTSMRAVDIDASMSSISPMRTPRSEQML